MFAILGQPAPSFAPGLILMSVFAVQLDWFPTSVKGGLSHMTLPGVALGYYNVAALMRCPPPPVWRRWTPSTSS